MFETAENTVACDSSVQHVSCYFHKLNLTVEHGLQVLGQEVSSVKLKIPQGVPLPILVLELNDGKDGIKMDGSESDEEDGYDSPDKPDGLNYKDDSVDENLEEVVCDKDNLVAPSIVKKSAGSFSLSLSLIPLSFVYLETK